MVLGLSGRTFARFGPSNISSTLLNQAIHQFQIGTGVVDTRNLLRAAGFRFSNQAITNIFREQRRIRTSQGSLNRIRRDFRPGPESLVPTPRRFGTRYQFTAQVEIFDADLGTTQSLNVQFGSDELLTRGEIIERAEGIAEEVAAKGGTGSDSPGMELGSVRLTSALEGVG